MSTTESMNNSLDEINEKELEQAQEDAVETPPKAPEVEQDTLQEEAEDEETPEAEPSPLEEESELDQVKAALTRSEAEVQSLKDQLVRLQAEFSNFRKRKEKEAVDMVRFANEDLIKNLLPILDNFDRTLDAIEKSDNLAAIKEGISLVDSSMKYQLQKIGLEPIACKGKPFDPALHDAISSLEVEEEEKKGTILDEVERGYVLKDKVIRFSKVIVAE